MNENENLFRSEDAVSETVGFSIILGIVVMAVGIMVVLAYPILGNLRESAFMETAVEASTMLDSKASMVAFRASSNQITRMNLNGGTLTADNSTSNRLIIKVSNYSGTDREIFNESLGRIEYVVNDQTIAYEGGGLFRKYESGEPVMISPPEFHYNGETLTFPIIKINNFDSIGGKGIVSINLRSNTLPVIVYPNLSSGADLRNPLFGKQIKIRLTSEYYKAWAKYIKERTGVITLTNDLTQEVIVSLNSKPSDQLGPLVIPIEVMGMDTTNSTPLNQLKFNLTGVDSDLHMVFRAPDQTSTDFSIEIQKRGGMGTSGVDIMIQYNKGGYNETWKSEADALIVDSNASINLLNSSSLTFYKTNDPSGTWINETYPYNRTYKQSEDAGPVPLNIILQHYFRLISDTGTFSIYPGTHSGDPAWGKGFNPSGSTFVLDYNVIPPRITYLHIVEHDVDVGLD
jgi:hypothetical protein